jgi:biotin carboxylase
VTTSAHQPVTTPRIAVIAGAPLLVGAARDLGIETVFVHDAFQPTPPVAAEADMTIAVDLSDLDALHAALAPLHAARPFARVMSLTEHGLLPAAAAGERLQVLGNSLHTVRLLRDKRRMREVLNSHGISPVRAAAPTNQAELGSFCRMVGGPVILKPAAGTGSEAVIRVATADLAAEAWRAFGAAGGVDPIAEEYLDGPEVSVETFSHGGRHALLAVTDKLVNASFVEVGHTQPSTLSAPVLAEVDALVRAFLNVIQLTEGPAHTEIRITAQGPRIIESHNRIGGDKISELLRRVYGLDMLALTAGCPLGLLRPPTDAPVARGGAAIRFLMPPPGTVCSIVVPDTGGTTADIHLKVAVGDQVRPGQTVDDRAGYIMVDGVDAADAAAVCEDLAARVLIETSG